MDTGSGPTLLEPRQSLLSLSTRSAVAGAGKEGERSESTLGVPQSLLEYSILYKQLSFVLSF